MKTIPLERVRDRVRLENPWWTEPPDSLPFAHLGPRPYLDLLRPLVRTRDVRRAVVLMGPRRVGKTVLLHHLVYDLIEEGTAQPGEIAYLSIDHPIYTHLSLDDAVGLLHEVAPAPLKFVFIDEIQYVKDWASYLKHLVDRSTETRFVVSGSAATALRREGAESGAGRFTDFELPPLTFYEYLRLLGKDDLVQIDEGAAGSDPPRIFSTEDIDELNARFFEYINYGGYPELLFSESARANPSRFVTSDIIEKVLLKDLPSLYGIQDVQELNSLFSTLAYNTGQEVSLDALSKTSGVTKTTLKRYTTYLEAAFLIRKIRRVDEKATRFKRERAFKIYLTNPSIRAALFSPISQDDDDAGHLVETAIFAQWFHLRTEFLHYARWKRGEVDLVAVQENRVRWLVEVKWSDRPCQDASMLDSIIHMAKKHSLKRALVTTRTVFQRSTHNGVEVRFVPASIQCFTLGYNILAQKDGTDVLREPDENMS